ncbi:MAG: septum formation inhibitor Maf [Nevskiaceae bacterium]|nr:MAG: septum formation inhibitor Maf [Nevskiaceae bacterium]
MSTSFYLASKSPRRQELLRQLHYRFAVLAADIPEQPGAQERPDAFARRMALEKARAVQPPQAELPVLGADTDVVLDGRILGKPRDRADALAMLAALSGRRHQVYSAVALVQGAREALSLSVTEVEFGRIDTEAAQRYWDSGEPADKAGAYGIQGLGAQFVKAIHGSYSGVVGLPLYETVQLLQQFHIHPGTP